MDSDQHRILFDDCGEEANEMHEIQRTMMILHPQWTVIPFLFAIFAPVVVVVVVQGFTVPASTTSIRRGTRNCNNMNQLYNPAGPLHRLFAAPVAPERVQIYADTDAVSAQIRNIVVAAATSAIAAKGIFYLAIPGGSILKMLVGSGDSSGDWTRRTVLAYVNHKCVRMDDNNLATHAKAMKLFLHQWDGCTPILLDGTADGVAEAKAYAAKLVASNIPTNTNGTPIFDLALIGVGDDGHIGSLYPHRPEVLLDDTSTSVLAVTMKSPPSITLSLPVMQNAHQVVVAACGVSEKYPMGKSDAMRRAIVSEAETVATFPAVGLREVATWIVDEAAASQLGEAYRTVVRGPMPTVL
jgi:6-phosphogluconolactonase